MAVVEEEAAETDDMALVVLALAIIVKPLTIAMTATTMDHE